VHVVVYFKIILTVAADRFTEAMYLVHCITQQYTLLRHCPISDKMLIL